MVDAGHRLKKKQVTSGPPGIVVKFISRLDKEEFFSKFLSKTRDKKYFSTRHLGLLTDQPLYINESLTLEGRKLMIAEREVKKTKKLQVSVTRKDFPQEI